MALYVQSKTGYGMSRFVVASYLGHHLVVDIMDVAGIDGLACDSMAVSMLGTAYPLPAGGLSATWSVFGALRIRWHWLPSR